MAQSSAPTGNALVRWTQTQGSWKKSAAAQPVDVTTAAAVR